jgi:hypothetical protein
MKRDLYAEVSARIIAELEAGAAPWVKPWSATPGANTPCNAVSNRPYSGCNVVLLWMAQAAGYRTPRFLTFKQALELGGNVRKGERGTKVYFVKQLQVRDQGSDDNSATRLIPMMREYTVFNVDQCEGHQAVARAGCWRSSLRHSCSGFKSKYRRDYGAVRKTPAAGPREGYTVELDPRRRSIPSRGHPRRRRGSDRRAGAAAGGPPSACSPWPAHPSTRSERPRRRPVRRSGRPLPVALPGPAAGKRAAAIGLKTLMLPALARA